MTETITWTQKPPQPIYIIGGMSLIAVVVSVLLSGVEILVGDVVPDIIGVLLSIGGGLGIVTSMYLLTFYTRGRKEKTIVAGLILVGFVILVSGALVFHNKSLMAAGGGGIVFVALFDLLLNDD